MTAVLQGKVPRDIRGAAESCGCPGQQEWLLTLGVREEFEGELELELGVGGGIEGHVGRGQEAWLPWVHWPLPHGPLTTPVMCQARSTTECWHLLCPRPEILPPDFFMAFFVHSNAHRASGCLSTGPDYLPECSRTIKVPLMMASWNTCFLPGVLHCRGHSWPLGHLPKGKTGFPLWLWHCSRHQAVVSKQI